MVDATKCKGEDCPYKDSCYRYMAKDEMYQSYFAEVPYDKGEDTCPYYWKYETPGAWFGD